MKRKPPGLWVSGVFCFATLFERSVASDERLARSVGPESPELQPEERAESRYATCLKGASPWDLAASGDFAFLEMMALSLSWTD